MLNPFCECFYFWSKPDDDPINSNEISQLEQSDVSLDVSRAGIYN